MNPHFLYTRYMNRRKKTTTSAIEWNTMLNFAERLYLDGEYRDYLLIIVGCHFGLRVSDLLNLKWDQLVGKNEVIVTESKTGKQRRIAINDRVKEAIDMCSEKLRNKNGHWSGEYIFENKFGGSLSTSYVNKRLKILFPKYGIYVDNNSTHALRKTFGRRLFELENESEKALIFLSEIFNHSNISITRKYLGISQKEISDAYMRL